MRTEYKIFLDDNYVNIGWIRHGLFYYPAYQVGFLPHVVDNDNPQDTKDDAVCQAHANAIFEIK